MGVISSGVGTACGTGLPFLIHRGLRHHKGGNRMEENARAPRPTPGGVGRSRPFSSLVFKCFLSFAILITLLGTGPVTRSGLGEFPSAQAASDPVIAAAGDIACDPASASFNNGSGTSSACRQKYTSDLLVNAGLAAVLDLGDNQYYCGGYPAFLQSYDLSWGRVKSITHPSVGNHEYLTSGGTGCDSSNTGAAGYFEYFGAAAGSPGAGYYSFDVGSWHIIALNSSCGAAGGCGVGSPQYNWLKSDLASHTSYCTLAFWHIPLFSSGGRASKNSQPFWQLLYNNYADVILNGHDHIYERFAPQDPTGALDQPRGLREFIVGTGGADHTTITQVAANSEVRNASTYGVLKLTLHASGYDWQFVHESSGTFADSGSGSCHGVVPDTTPPSAPTNLAATSVTSSQVSLSWTASKDNVGVAGYRVYRNSTQIAWVTSTSYADKTVLPQTTYSYYVVAYDAAGLTSSPSNTVSVTTPSSATATPTPTPTRTATPSPTATLAQSITFKPQADAYVQSAYPAANFGTGTTLRADGSPDVHSYLRFAVTGLNGSTVTRAQLQLYMNSTTSYRLSALKVGTNAWGETTVTYNTAPRWERR